MLTFKDRFYTLVSESGKNMFEIANDLGVSKQTISAWCTGVRSPRKPMIETIARKFNVNIPWLMGISDERTPYRPAVSELPNDEPSAPSDDPTFVTLAHKLRKLDPENLKKVDKALTALFPEDFT